MFGLPHPEAGEGEVWFCNGTREGFARMSWHTKRLGQVAYDSRDQPNPEVWPIFVQRQELLDANEPIPQDAMKRNEPSCPNPGLVKTWRQ